MLAALISPSMRETSAEVCVPSGGGGSSLCAPLPGARAMANTAATVAPASASTAIRIRDTVPSRTSWPRLPSRAVPGRRLLRGLGERAAQRDVHREAAQPAALHRGGRHAVGGSDDPQPVAELTPLLAQHLGRLALDFIDRAEIEHHRPVSVAGAVNVLAQPR